MERWNSIYSSWLDSYEIVKTKKEWDVNKKNIFFLYQKKYFNKKFLGETVKRCQLKHELGEEKGEIAQDQTEIETIKYSPNGTKLAVFCVF